MGQNPTEKSSSNDEDFPPLPESSGSSPFCAEQLKKFSINPNPVVLNARKQYIVPDTSVMMENLKVIMEIVEKEPNKIVFISETVRHELDNLKSRDDKPREQKLASVANKFMREADTAYHQNGRIVQQSGHHAKEANELIPIHKNDDKIIACALKLKKEGKHVTLFTRDNNMYCSARSVGVDPHPPVTQESMQTARSRMYLKI